MVIKLIVNQGKFIKVVNLRVIKVINLRVIKVINLRVINLKVISLKVIKLKVINLDTFIKVIKVIKVIINHYIIMAINFNIFIKVLIKQLDL